MADKAMREISVTVDEDLESLVSSGSMTAWQAIQAQTLRDVQEVRGKIAAAQDGSKKNCPIRIVARKTEGG